MTANEIKTSIQKEAHAIWIGAGRQGTIAAGTGFGKSRIAVMEARRMADTNMFEFDNFSEPNILLVSPTERLRDDNWPKEFEAWGEKDLYDGVVKSICFASLKKEVGTKYKLVILDEIHRLTEMSANAFRDTGEDVLTEFLAENLADAVLGLTATVPDHKRDPEKYRIIAQVAPVVFQYSLDQGVADGMIADYEIRVIESTLDHITKNMTAGTKAKPFMTTEAKQYEYMEKQIKKWRMLENSETDPTKAASFSKLADLATWTRNRFLYNLPSKTKLAQACIKLMTTGQFADKRSLVFCRSIDQCDKLLGTNVFPSKAGKAGDIAFKAFNAKEINLLGVVNAANEGINFVDLDQILIIQLDSNVRNLVQRIGRVLRIREGHKAIIYILSVKDTADESWLEKSLEGFDRSKVTYYSSKNVPQ
jgi:superfamily II DNA or RNA helicase